VPCDHTLVKCAECGQFVDEEEWLQSGRHAKSLGPSGDTLKERLTGLLLVGTRLKFCSAECEQRHDEGTAD